MNEYIIEEIKESEFAPFYPLMAEIEVGSLFDETKPNHMLWLCDKIKLRYASGTVFFALYSQEGVPIGIAGVQVEKTLEGVPYLGRKSELMDIAVFEEYRNMGYGTKLIEYAEQFAKSKGAYCMYAATIAIDYETVSFYGKNKFVPIATLVDVNGPNEEGALYMRKIL